MENKTQKNQPIVYVGMSADIIHPGHINLLNEATKYGRVIVGLLTDEAIASYKRVPILTYSQRFSIVSNLVGVSEVISQESLDYTRNLNLLKPNFVVHGDDWKSGIQSKTRAAVIKALEGWGGNLIEVPYFEGISSTQLINKLKRNGITPDFRVNSLQRLLRSKPYLRFADVHSGISALIIEHTSVEKNGLNLSFDGMWSSSLVDSTSRGKPDNESVDISTRINGLQQVLEVTTKPIIFDGDTGGRAEHFMHNVRTLERNGISAVIIEDKIGLKRNSLYGNEVIQNLDDPINFSEKIKAGLEAKANENFMIIARIESLIVDAGMNDALNRAQIYLDAGADGIMIHSRNTKPDEIFEFAAEYKKWNTNKPLVLVPTTFNSVIEEDLAEKGARIIIHANHLLRASYPAMVKVAEKILQNGRTLEADSDLMSIKEILNLVPGG